MRFKLRRNRTLAAQILLFMLLGSLLPLIILGVLNGQTARTHFNLYSESQLGLTEAQYIELYETYLKEQVNVINAELQKIENAVEDIQAVSEAVFSESDNDLVVPVQFNEIKNGLYLRFVPLEGQSFQQLYSVQDSEEIKKDLSKSMSLDPIFASEMKRNPNILAIYYIHPKGAFNYFSSTMKVINTRDNINWGDLSVENLPYYQDALTIKPNEHKVVWSKPYEDVASNDIYMFTASAPIYDREGQLRGVVAADVSITDFVQNILNVQFNDEFAYAFLLGKDHRLITIQNRGQTDFTRLSLNLSTSWDGIDGYTELKANDQTKMLFTKIVPSTGWMLAYVIPKEHLLSAVTKSSRELTNQTNQHLIKQNILITLAAVVICILLSIFLWRKISRPIQSLKNAFIDVGNGNFSVSIHGSPFHEFDHLSKTFNRMSERIGELMGAQIQLNEELEGKVKERTLALSDLNEELQLRIEELIRIEGWRKKWISHISHDLKTPSTVAQGYIDAILDGKIPADQSEHYLVKIEQRIQTITALVKDLNDLSLLETGQIKPILKPIDVDDFFEALMYKWSDPLTWRDMILVREPGQSDATIQADEHLVGRVVDNLVSNAMKYSPRQSRIVWSIRESNGFVYLAIKDEGIGIPEEAIPYIFDSFYRVDSSRNSRIPGSGLGLSIAREIMLLHGGTIEVFNNPDAGCTFVAGFPIIIHSV